MANIQYHLFEIKLRFFYLMFSAFCTFLIFYNFQIEIVYLIGKPFIKLQQTFIFLDLTEAFYTLLKISTIFTILLEIPFFLYHSWSFFIPSFYRFQRKGILFFCVFFVSFFLLEIFLIYFLLLPKICHFLLSFEMTSNLGNSGLLLKPFLNVEFTARIESYVKLIVKISSVMFLVFQMPLAVCILYSKKILFVSSLHTNRKFLFLISLLMSAFLVPPDFVSQLIVATFFSFVIEILIFIGVFFE